MTNVQCSAIFIDVTVQSIPATAATGMTQTGGTYLNRRGTASNQNDRIIDASFFGRFPPKTNITSLFVLFIQSVFVKLKFNLHSFAKGQANIRGGGGGGGVYLNSIRK